MTEYLTRSSGWRVVILALAVAVSATGCGARSKKAVPADVAQPDRYLFDRGTEALQKERWIDAREYFRQVVDNYPGSALRADAKLGLGDAYLSEGGTENLVLAANEFREFLTFYPTHARADYAQYKLAMTHHRQMRAPERDQTATKDALKEFDTFFERYPNSPLMPEVRMKWREARDRLSESSFDVGLHYYRSRWYLGAVSRFKEILKDDPGYTHRDEVYFYLGESLLKMKAPSEALPYFDRLVTEFQASEHLDDAKRRVQELKTQ